MNSGTCDVDDGLVEKLKAFRLNKSKDTRAFIVKVDKLRVIEDKILDPTTWEDLQDSMPDTMPRYVVASFEMKHKDDRVSYPLVMLYYVPESAKIDLKMIYSSAKPAFVQAADLGAKVIDIQDLENVNYEYISARLLPQ